MALAKIISSNELLNAQAHIWNQTFSFMNSASLKCAVELGIADAIDKHGKAMTLSELSAAIAINPSKAPFIHRLMRVLVNSGFFVEQIILAANNDEADDDKIGYALAPFVGRLLLKDEPMNARAVVLMVLDPVMVKPWNALSNWFQNDEPTSFATVHGGKNFWDYASDEPKFGKLFNEAMASDSHLIVKVLISEFRFVFEDLTSMVEVGGGTGTVSRAIAKAFPSLKCTVFDLPHVVDVANMQESPVDFIAGDMFGKIPLANAILLKWILHDWDDEDCLKILKNCKKGIPEKEKGGKVMIIDTVMERKKEEKVEEMEEEAQICLDMQMMVLYGAKERSEKEWAILFQKSGFSSYKVFSGLGSRSLIEVYP